MNVFEFNQLLETRRQFFGRGARGLGQLALASLLGDRLVASDEVRKLPHFPPKVKRAVWLHMVGAPPQMDLFDYKPGMKDWYDKDLPESVRQGQRLTTMTSGQTRFPIAPSIFKFAQHGQGGAWISELVPNMAKMADDLMICRSLHTEAINHEPAITFAQTGNQIPGRPCIGSWLSYGLGSMNEDLPTFVVLTATHSNAGANVQAISNRLWSSGFLSGEFAGVNLRAAGDPVLFINNPAGVDSKLRRRMLDGVNAMNQEAFDRLHDPETHTRISQYEMAFRMQASVPELTDLSKENEATLNLYGPEAKKSGTFANSCLMTRRLLERGVRFVQIYHRGWDVHSNVAGVLPSQCQDVDQAAYALVQDLKQRGMLEDTLVIWGGEFGRTIYSQGQLSQTNYGRDHHPRCFTMWMAGGGVKGGSVYGETDDFSYNIVRDPVHLRDWHATMLHQFGIDHEHFTFKYQGLDQRLTGVEPAKVVKGLLA